MNGSIAVGAWRPSGLEGSFGTYRICGHTFVPRWIHAGSKVVDFGMNRGEFGHALAAMAGCRVWGAEPDPRLYAEIAPSPKVVKQQVAIAGRDGRTRFHLNSAVCSSMVFSDGSQQPGGDSYEVEVLTLESFMRQHGIDRIDLLKMDIEGAEIEMFDAASDEALASIGQITIEFHQFMDRRYEADVRRITQRLERLGFRGYDFSRDCYDVLFVNTRLHPFGLPTAWSFRVAKYARGLDRKLREWTGRPEAPSWTVADDLARRALKGGATER